MNQTQKDSPSGNYVVGLSDPKGHLLNQVLVGNIRGNMYSNEQNFNSWPTTVAEFEVRKQFYLEIGKYGFAILFVESFTQLAVPKQKVSYTYSCVNTTES